MEALDCLEVYARTGLREALQKARRLHRLDGNAASHALSHVDPSDRAARLLAQASSLATSAVWSCTKTRPTQAAMGYCEAAQAAESIRLSDDPSASPRPGHNWQPASTAELAIQCQILRDIFGNPFRSVAFDSNWCTSTTVTLARQMYDSRGFSAMPILADALEDAGCGSADILDHCRAADGVHVRGCWVVDLVLGKE
jgi:hypothetical protein